MGTATAVTEQTFETDVLQAGQPVLVDFWAEWCGPCKAIAPVLEEIASEQNGRLKVVKVDVDKNPGVAARYGIRGIPTLLLFKDGNEVERFIGAKPKQAILDKVQPHLG